MKPTINAFITVLLSLFLVWCSASITDQEQKDDGEIVNDQTNKAETIQDNSVWWEMSDKDTWIEEIDEPIVEPKAIWDEALSFLNLPEWFIAQSYANVANARSLEIVETLESYVTFVGNRTESSVYAVIDKEKDFVVDEIIEIASWLNSPNGVAYKEGDLYVAEIDRILKFSNILNTVEDASYEVIFDDLPDDADHWRKYIAFGPDGKLYLPIWAPCNICDAWSPYSALHTLDLESKEFTQIAEWIRNTVWFDRHPKTWELRFTDNGRDRMGDDVPADELNILKSQWSHFGYPFCHGGDVQDPEYDSRNCNEFIAPFTKLGPHVAALGMMFSDRADIPAPRDDHILIAERGSWNRTIPIGYRISAVDLSTGEYKTFIDGWLQGTEVLWRPVDITSFADGSLLISDDTSWRLYRIVYVGDAS